MLILPAKDQLRERVREERKGLEEHFNREFEKILNENTSKDKYWVLGKVKFPDAKQNSVGRTFLQACEEKPGLVKNAFLYEVDNRRGVKTLLWVMNPDGSMNVPTLNKTIQT